jgi:hypothetical protein
MPSPNTQLASGGVTSSKLTRTDGPGPGAAASSARALRGALRRRGRGPRTRSCVHRNLWAGLLLAGRNSGRAGLHADAQNPGGSERGTVHGPPGRGVSRLASDVNRRTVRACGSSLTQFPDLRGPCRRAGLVGAPSTMHYAPARGSAAQGASVPSHSPSKAIPLS